MFQKSIECSRKGLLEFLTQLNSVGTRTLINREREIQLLVVMSR